jgi:hypothetical protein
MYVWRPSSSVDHVIWRAIQRRMALIKMLRCLWLNFLGATPQHEAGGKCQLGTLERNGTHAETIIHSAWKDWGRLSMANP